MSKQDTINHPEHYNERAIECRDAIGPATVGLSLIEAAYTGKAIQYLWVWKSRRGVKDLVKAKGFIELLSGNIASEQDNVNPRKYDSSSYDSVNHPPHYNKGAIECIDAIEAATVGLVGIEAVCTGNAIKYLWRWKFKGGAQDLKKATWYIERLISNVRKESEAA